MWLIPFQRIVTFDLVNRGQVIAALRLLGDKAWERGIRLEVSIYGGSAFLLAWNSREATRDIDAILHPAEVGWRLVDEVTRENNLPEGWISDQVQQFVSPLREAKRRLPEIEALTGLVIRVPSARYLLAMKALAARRPLGHRSTDFDDLRFLIRKMEIRSVDEVQDAIDAFFPDNVLRRDLRDILAELIQEATNEPGND